MEKEREQEKDWSRDFWKATLKTSRATDTNATDFFFLINALLE